jgi:hypothetical protein
MISIRLALITKHEVKSFLYYCIVVFVRRRLTPRVVLRGRHKAMPAHDEDDVRPTQGPRCSGAAGGRPSSSRPRSGQPRRRARATDARVALRARQPQRRVHHANGGDRTRERERENAT